MALNVLVADDSATIQKVIKIAFSRLDAEIFEASSKADAVRQLRSHQIDLLVVDAKLPGGRGPQCILEIAEYASSAPVLVLAGSYDGVDENEYKVAGLEHIVKKPFDSADLLRLVENLLGTSLEGPTVLNAPPPPINLEETAIKSSPSVGLPPPPPPPNFGESRSHFGEEHSSSFGSGSIEATLPAVPGAQEISIDLDDLPKTVDQPDPVVEKHVRAAVESWCDKNLKAIVREVVVEELRLLAEQRSRYMADE